MGEQLVASIFCKTEKLLIYTRDNSKALGLCGDGCNFERNWESVDSERGNLIQHPFTLEIETIGVCTPITLHSLIGNLLYVP